MSAGRNLITLFFTVNTLLHFFLAKHRCVPHPEQQNSVRTGVRASPKSMFAQQLFQKSTSFPLFFFSSALSQPLERFNSTVATPVRRHSLPPVRQLKIFFPTVALPTSHEQKCANLLRA
ncbi:hypothetical protein BRN55_14895 [Xanthomonas oryzae pv. oryzae]|uniref:hypothetical protein n=1 Tax=Xanthomonas oryzae TaxID=347 RepID=UPI000E38E411|nr:hypothetical protein [Xanthomonas oryzae]REI36598.1 hypothetical protein BRN55_14895 [Xanthomonas oryzae pv. oryzae]